MRVKFFGYMRDYTGCKETDVKGYETLRELLAGLSRVYGERFGKEVLKDVGISDRIIVLVNGRNIVFLNGVDTHLEDSDEVSIFPVVAGG
ncbi:MAG: MoaD family protein [Thermoanaerobacteraceae bacterium]|nr:MoaD family protein [Thermoanaerobacteraceae bacterium]